MPGITACSSLAFSLSSLEVALKHIAGYGLEYVEIAEMLSHAKHFQVDTVDPLSVRKLLKKYSLKPVAANINLAVLYTGKPGLVPSKVRNVSSVETEAVQKAKQQRVHYRLHVKTEAELYAARAKKLIDKAQAAGFPCWF